MGHFSFLLERAERACLGTGPSPQPLDVASADEETFGSCDPPHIKRRDATRYDTNRVIGARLSTEQVYEGREILEPPSRWRERVDDHGSGVCLEPSRLNHRGGRAMKELVPDPIWQRLL